MRFFNTSITKMQSNRLSQKIILILIIKMEVKNDILAIFHEVKTDVQGQHSVNGTFVVASQMGELVFLWRSYSKFKKNDQEKPHEIKIYFSNVQKIIVNFQENDYYIFQYHRLACINSLFLLHLHIKLCNLLKFLLLNNK